MLQLLAFFEAEALHDFRHAIGRAEVAHQIVLEADVEVRRARDRPGARSGRATGGRCGATSWRSVPMTIQSARVRHAGAELDVGAAAGHVGGDGDRARLAGARDDLGFLQVIFRVEHVCGIFSRFSMRQSNSLASTLTVPTRTGWPLRVALL